MSYSKAIVPAESNMFRLLRLASDLPNVLSSPTRPLPPWPPRSHHRQPYEPLGFPLRPGFFNPYFWWEMVPLDQVMWGAGIGRPAMMWLWYHQIVGLTIEIDISFKKTCHPKRIVEKDLVQSFHMLKTYPSHVFVVDCWLNFIITTKVVGLKPSFSNSFPTGSHPPSIHPSIHPTIHPSIQPTTLHQPDAEMQRKVQLPHRWSRFPAHQSSGQDESPVFLLFGGERSWRLEGRGCFLSTDLLDWILDLCVKISYLYQLILGIFTYLNKWLWEQIGRYPFWRQL